MIVLGTNEHEAVCGEIYLTLPYPTRKLTLGHGHNVSSPSIGNRAVHWRLDAAALEMLRRQTITLHPTTVEACSRAATLILSAAGAERVAKVATAGLAALWLLSP